MRTVADCDSATMSRLDRFAAGLAKRGVAGVRTADRRSENRPHLGEFAETFAAEQARQGVAA